MSKKETIKFFNGTEWVSLDVDTSAAGRSTSTDGWLDVATKISSLKAAINRKNMQVVYRHPHLSRGATYKAH